MFSKTTEKLTEDYLNKKDKLKQGFISKLSSLLQSKRDSIKVCEVGISELTDIKQGAEQEASIIIKTIQENK